MGSGRHRLPTRPNRQSSFLSLCLAVEARSEQVGTILSGWNPAAGLTAGEKSHRDPLNESLGGFNAHLERQSCVRGTADRECKSCEKWCGENWGNTLDPAASDR